MMKTVVMAAGISALIASSAGAGVIQENNQWYKDGEKTLQEKLAVSSITNQAKNVILFVADGDGVPTNYATRLFMGQQAGGYGDDFVLPAEKMPYLALAKTYNTNAQTPDSAGTSTAMNTGVKSKAGVLGVSEIVGKGVCSDMKKEGAVVQDFAELMHDEGKEVGFVTTARITHATPAAGYAHSAHRNWEDDSKIPEGCDQKDIAAQLFDKLVSGEVNLAMGGGRRHFIPQDSVGDEGHKGKRKDGRNLIEEAKAKGVQYAWDDKTFSALKLDTNTPILGLFEKSHMKYEHDRAGEPSLAEMTEAAIRYLSKNKNGYYLLVEGGRVDHANHAGNAYRTVTDNEAFAKAVAKAMAMTDPQNTLIIATADHGHGMAMNGYCGRGSDILGLCYEIDTKGTVHLDKPNLAADEKPYTVIGYLNGPGAVLKKQEDGSYSGSRPVLTQAEAKDPDFLQQSLIPKSSESHSGVDVAIYARGPWAHLLDGTVEQNYVFHVMNYAVHNRK